LAYIQIPSAYCFSDLQMIKVFRDPARASHFVRKLCGLSDGDRLRIEAKLDELRSRLDEVPVYANVRSFPASFAS
jgi:hypothetical protein